MDKEELIKVSLRDYIEIEKYLKKVFTHKTEENVYDDILLSIYGGKWKKKKL